MKKVLFKFDAPAASGRRKGWAKWLLGMNPGGEGLRQFKGDFVPQNHKIEVEEGRLFVVCGFEGSAKYSRNIYRLNRVKRCSDDPYKNFEEIGEFDTKDDFPEFCEAVKERLQAGADLELTKEDIAALKEKIDDPLLLQKVLKKIEK